MLERHHCLHDDTHHMSTHPTPMYHDNSYLRSLETQDIPTDKEIKSLEREMGFGYRQAISELIYALVTCRPDISIAVMKLAQYSTKPQQIHFEAIKQVYRYLQATKDEGIYFWRKRPELDLPAHPLPTTKNDNNYNEHGIEARHQHSADVLHGAVDSDFAGDTTHRKSVTGTVLRLAGGTVFYKSRYQDTCAQSSTEAEFLAAAEASKYIIYVRTILTQIGLPQHVATVLFEDNQGALMMDIAQQPTKRTRHMSIKHFAIQDWVLKDLITLEYIKTADNYSDALTQPTAKVLFYRHMEYILGKVIPSYIQFPDHHTQDILEQKSLTHSRKGDIAMYYPGILNIW